MTRIGLHGHRQLTLGELIRAIEALPLTFDQGGPHPKRVSFDFGQTFPVDLTSYRGSYAELAMTFGDTYRQGVKIPTAEAVLAMLKDALRPGRTFGGWKGGEYQMRDDTPVWVAQWGEWGSTAVVGVRDLGVEIVIDTEWCEF